MTEVLLLAVTMVLFREKVAESPLLEATLDIPVGPGRSKIVGIASGLSFFRQDIPIVGAIADTGWKQSSLKCFSHKNLCLDHRYYTLRRTRDLWNGPSKRRYYTLRTLNLQFYLRFRSPLLTESHLISFPPSTEMFQFLGFIILFF